MTLPVAPHWGELFAADETYIGVGFLLAGDLFVTAGHCLRRGEHLQGDAAFVKLADGLRLDGEIAVVADDYDVAAVQVTPPSSTTLVGAPRLKRPARVGDPWRSVCEPFDNAPTLGGHVEDVDKMITLSKGYRAPAYQLFERHSNLSYQGHSGGPAMTHLADPSARHGLSPGVLGMLVKQALSPTDISSGSEPYTDGESSHVNALYAVTLGALTQRLAEANSQLMPARTAQLATSPRRNGRRTSPRTIFPLAWPSLGRRGGGGDG